MSGGHRNPIQWKLDERGTFDVNGRTSAERRIPLPNSSRNPRNRKASNLGVTGGVAIDKDQDQFVEHPANPVSPSTTHRSESQPMRTAIKEGSAL